MQKPSITYILAGAASDYFTGDGWDRDIRKACLYATAGQAESALRAARRERGSAAVCCVIQDGAFDFYDGRRFVYSLLEAKVYSPLEAETALRGLAG